MVNSPLKWSEVTGDPRWNEAPPEKKKEILSKWSQDVLRYAEESGQELDADKHLTFLAGQRQLIDHPITEPKTDKEIADRIAADAMARDWGEDPDNPAPDNKIGTVRSTIGSIGQGAAQVASSVPKYIATLAKQTDLFGEYEGKEVKDLATYKFGQAIEDLSKEYLPTNPKHERKFLTGTLPSAMGQLGGFMGGGLAAAPLKTSQMGTTALLGVSATAASAYDEAKEKGATEQQALDVAMMTAPTGMLDVIVPNRLVGSLYKKIGGQATHSLFKEALKEGTLEGATEVVQQVLGNAGAKAVYDENRDLLEGMIESGGAGGISAGFASALISVATGRRVRPKAVDNTETAQQEEVVEQQPKVEEQVKPEVPTFESPKDELAALENDSDFDLRELEEQATSQIPTEEEVAVERKISSVEKERQPAIFASDNQDQQGYIDDTNEANVSEPELSLYRKSSGVGRRSLLLQYQLEQLPRAERVIEGLGARIAKASGGKIKAGVGYGSNGDIELVVDPERIAESLAKYDDPVAAKTAIRDIFEEEVIHTAHVSVLKDLWKQTNSKSDFKEFVDSNLVSLVDEMQRLSESYRKAGDGRADKIDQALVDSWNIYYGKEHLDRPSDFTNARDLYKHLQKNPVEVPKIAAEVVRQMVQLRKNKQFTTETRFLQILNKLTEWVKAALDRMKISAKAAGDGEIGLLLREAIVKTEAKLNGIEKVAKLSKSEAKTRFFTKGSEEITPQFLTKDDNEGIGVVAPTWKRVLRAGGPFESAVDTLKKAGGKVAELGRRIEKYYDDEVATEAAIRKPFNEILRSLPRKERKAALDQFEKIMELRESAKSFDTAGKTQEATITRQEMSQLMGRVNPHTQQLLAEVERMFERMNGVNQKLKIKVYDPVKKTFRPIGAVKEYWPRMLRKDIAEILQQGGDLKPTKYNEYLTELQTFLGVDHVKAEKFLRDYRDMVKTNGFFGNIEAARVGNLPPKWFEYRFERVIPNYTDRWAQRVAQIKHFGQRIGKGEIQKDIFDKLASESMSGRTRAFIGAVQTKIYQEEPNTAWHKWMQRLRAYTTVSKLANIASAIRNLSTILVNTMPEFGVIPGLRAMVNIRDNIMKAEEAGVLRSDLIAGMAEAREFTETQAKVISGALKYTGFSLVEAFNRSHAMAAGLSWARFSIKKIVKDPDSRSARIALAKLQKYGVDWQKLKAEFDVGDYGVEAKKLARAAANSTQFTYDMRQVPAWMESPYAKFFFQFQKFGFSMSRRVVEEIIKPATIGYTVNDKKVRDIRPAVMTLAGAILTGEGLLMLMSMLFDKERPDASWQEISETMTEDQSRAMGLALERLWHDLIWAGGLGIGGEWTVTLIEDPAKRLRGKNPIEPPSFGTVRNVFENLIIRGYEQGGLTWRDSGNFLFREVPGIRYGWAGAAKTAGTIGAEWEASELQRSRAVLFKARASMDRFLDEQGIEKPAILGSFSRTERSPYYDRLTEALTLGDTLAAKEVISEMMNEAKDNKDKKIILRAIKSSVSSRGPLKVDKELRKPYLQWLQKRDEALYEDFREVSKTYYQTSKKLGLLSTDLSTAMK